MTNWLLSMSVVQLGQLTVELTQLGLVHQGHQEVPESCTLRLSGFTHPDAGSCFPRYGHGVGGLVLVTITQKIVPHFLVGPGQ